MNSKYAATAIVSLMLLISLAACIQSVETANANPGVFALMPNTYLHSPSNQTYTTNSILASATVELSEKIYVSYSPQMIEFYLDMHTDNFKTIKASAICNGTTSDGWLIFYANTTIENIPDGNHTISIGFTFGSLGTVYNPVAYFMIESDNQNPTPNPTIPTNTPTTLPTASPIPIITPSNSPIQQPTIEPTLTASPSQPIEIGYRSDDLTYKIVTILTGIIGIIIVAVIGVIIYFKKVKK